MIQCKNNFNMELWQHTATPHQGAMHGASSANRATAAEKHNCIYQGHKMHERHSASVADGQVIQPNAQ